MVINMHDTKFDSKKHIRIDRKTIYGNPFVIGKDGSRKDVIAKHFAYLDKRVSEDDVFNAAMDALAGKLNEGFEMACWCSPEPCHAKNLFVWLNNRGYLSSEAKY